jgi:ribosomal subunit interface protein
MQLSVNGKQIDIGDALRQHIDESLSTIFGKYFGDAIEASVTLSREGHSFRAQLSAHVGRGIEVTARGEADRPYAAFDGAADRLSKRLRRYKRRLRDHHKENGGATEVTAARQYVLAAEDTGDSEAAERADGEPAVIAEMQAEIPTLTVSEAVMRLDLAELTAMLFRNRAHGGLNMIYRRPDGNVGWVDPQGNPRG